MRRATIVAAALSLSSNSAAADPALAEEPDTARTVDLAGGLVVGDLRAGRGRVRPGVAMAARFYSEKHLYASGGVAAAVDATDGPVGTGLTTTLFSVAGGAGLWGERGAWTGYAGVRGEWLKNLDSPERASLDRNYFTSGIGAGPSVALARRIATAWGHPMAIELSAGYTMYALRRPQLSTVSAREPDPISLDGFQLGLFLAGTLFPDRP